MLRHMLIAALTAGWVLGAGADNFEDCVFYDSADVPVVIPDDEETATFSEITIAESFVITDVNVRVDITHPWTADVELFLESPDGTMVELATGNGGSANNFTATMFDDQALSSITTQPAPFTGCFRPEGNLGTLNGENAQGTWKLHLFDNFVTQSGTLTAWQLQFDCYCGELEEGKYASGDTPLAIPDDGINSASSTIAVADATTITDVDVTINITHTFMGDLVVTLQSPQGTIVSLASHRGGFENGYTNTRFDDEAAVAIGAGTPPYTGSFRPESPLSVLDGQSAQGTWTLKVEDTELEDSGTLNGWSLHINSPAPAPEIDVFPASIAFGYQSKDAGPTASEQVTIENDGNATLNISNIALGGANPGQYAIVSGGGAQTLPAEGALAVLVQFNPTTTGSKPATLVITSDDTSEPTVTVTLSGTGFDPAAGVSAESWVDFNHLGTEEGTQALPWNSVPEGVDFVQPGGDVLVKAGSGGGAMTITKALTLDAVGGLVRIGVD